MINRFARIKLSPAAALVLAASVMAASSSFAVADAFSAGWDFAGVVGVSTLAPTATATNVTLTDLTLGSGVAVPSSPASNAFGGNAWDGSTDAATAITNNDFVSFTIAATPDNSISLSSISAYNIRRSSSGPTTGLWQYSLDGTTFQNIGGAITWGTVTTATGNLQPVLDLSSIAALQNVNAGTTVTFRVVNWNASGATGTWYFNNFGTAGNLDLIINGVTGPTVVPGIPNYFDTNGSAAGVGVNGGTAVWDNTTPNFTGLADGTGTPAVYDPAQATFFAGTAGTVTVDNVAPTKGIQFDSSGYVLNGGTITLVTIPNISVTNVGDTATVNSKISSSIGLAKGGAGTLVLGSTTSDFTGGVVINGGTLSISSDANLGNSANTILFNNGVLQTTASLSTARSISGPAILDIAPGTTLETSGTINLASLNLKNAGTLDLKVSAPTLGNVVFTGGGTIASSDNQVINASLVTATDLNGTATISSSGGLNLGTGTKTLDVGENGTVVVNAPISLSGTGNNSLRKTGLGTLELNGVNSSLYRVQLGSASINNPLPGGTIKINNNQALGVNQVFLNNGTLQPTVDLTGANALSIGASISGLDNGVAVITGSNLEFAGASAIFQFTNVQNHLTVNNTTTFSGTFGSGGSAATGTGFTLDGTGRMIVNGDASAMTLATNIGGGVTLAVNNNWAAPITINGGGTLAGSGTSTAAVVAGTGPHTIAPSAVLAAGSVATLTVAALTTSPETTLAIKLNTPGAASVNDAINVTGADGLTLNGGTLVITANTTGAGSLGYYKVLQYSGAIQGAGLASLVLPASPGGKIVYTLDAAHDPGFIDIHRGFEGDANDDGTVTFQDFISLANNFGLANAGWGGGDFDGNGVTNFIDYVTLANNFGQTVGGSAIVVSADELALFQAASASFVAAHGTAVPEPASLALLGIGAASLLARRRKH